MDKMTRREFLIKAAGAFYVTVWSLALARVRDLLGRDSTPVRNEDRKEARYYDNLAG
ncbi:MAG: hypothetical protein JW844_02680 [Candidatus Omnitrophica bacterium]|nr:hypothetical protein [Candidatus Omnitrophota bacterium]